MTPIQLDPNHQFNSLADTTLEQAQANTRFAVQAEVTKVNAAKAADYETQWKAYVAARDARPDATNLITPAPAREEAVDMDLNGWPTVYTTDNPVVAPRTYVPSVKTQGGFFTAGTAGAALAPSADSLLANAQLYKPFTYGQMTFQRLT